MSDNTISSTTQEYLDVYDITNDMVILKDGVVSMVLQIGTMNFSLLAEQEQDAIMYTYGAMLNSLNFPIQINVQSNIKDATRYLRLLDGQIKQTKSREKAQLIAEYREFVANLIRERNVLEKKFFVVIPTNAGEMGLYTAENVLPGKTKFNINNFEKTVLIEKAITVLEPRRDHLIAQFNRIGLFARQLDTQEIIKIFYINYNPESMEGQEVTHSENYTTPLVRASLAGEQSSEQISQNFRQTLTSSLGQRTDLDNLPILDQDQDQKSNQNQEQKREESYNQPTAVQAEKEVDVAKTEEVMSVAPNQAPNFSEEISSLQKIVNDNSQSSLQNNEQALPKFNITTKPTEPTKLAAQEDQLPKLKLEIPPAPTIGQTNVSTNNKPGIAEL